MRSRLTYANVVATLALFLALGGASYAALTLPRNSVGAAQLRNGSVTRAKVGFPVEMAVGTLGHTVSVGTVAHFQCPAALPCSVPPPPPPKVIAVATIKLTRPANVLILGSLSVERSTSESADRADTLEVPGDARLGTPFLNVADGYSATVTGQHVTTEQPGTHHYYLKVGGYVSSPTQATEAQIVAIALPGAELSSCPSGSMCAR